ncbi:site-specific DNA-methyltransferase [Porphyromonas somerae]|uniref:DNA-methyltransferase n=1 Tax=Porphyromonas somerae TaxID=322095 RepID=UPI002A75F910|nr:site-specific DNA-methyltransferase [Porphyromonas somerae]MDY3120496.1 site-specific DNA-methyltransferase [Porphyromonas somerae]MDY3884959.1 site-specific DNA-methyltransferase [Porphyromonas somerae]MDY5815513.1 site-specific DNA-methyltransferase [Porphyromonas somerae]
MINYNQQGQVYFKDSSDMSEIPDNSVQLIVTSPPYFNIKDYSKDGYQLNSHSKRQNGQIGDICNYRDYIDALLRVWEECERVLVPNGKLAINTPMMPMLKSEMDTHHNRHIFDINSDIQQSILYGTSLFLLDTYFWNRVNPSKSLMFGSYPYPSNFYAQNTTEFISIYVKDGKPVPRPPRIKELSTLTQGEWVEFTKQIWDIPIPNKSDIAFGKHSAIMPEEIPYRLIKLYSFYDDIILDPFTGSGTTLKVAKELGRKYIGYEIVSSYKTIIEEKLLMADSLLFRNTPIEVPSY